MIQISALNGLFRLSESTTLGRKRQLLRRQIVSLLYHFGALSNPDLSRRLNISIPTMNRILTEMIGSGIINDMGPGDSIGGRRPNLYGLNAESGYVLAIDISRFSVKIALMNLHNEFVGNIIHFKKPLTNSEDYVDFIVDQALKFANEACNGTENLIGAGIAIPGLINPQAGTTYTHLTFSEKPIRYVFQEKLGIPVFTDNDARMMTLGEFRFGQARGKANILCLNIGAGLGMGMIFDGKIYQGSSGFAGEFGHIRVMDDGVQCYCGKSGCLETMTAGPALERRLAEELEKGAGSSLRNIHPVDYSDVIRAAMADDSLAIRLVSECGTWLGKGLATLLHLYNPEMIILGGIIAQTGPLLLDPVNQALNEYAISKVRREARILVSDLGDRAALLGAHSIVINQVFTL